MRLTDSISWVLRAVLSARARSALTALGIAIGIASVTLLTSVGEGVKLYLLNSFSQFGTHLIAVTPGKTSTAGIGSLLKTVRPLTLDDAESLAQLPYVLQVVPVVQGTGRIEFQQYSRDSAILGVNHQAAEAWRFNVASGRFLPPDDTDSARPYAVLGSKLKTELFGESNPLGQRVRVGGTRFHIVGVMESKGQMLGFDLDDVIYIPAGLALQLFNREELMEVDVVFDPAVTSEQMSQKISQRLEALHGRVDFTLFTQEDMLSTLGEILAVIQIAVGSLGGISLLVGGVGVTTIMTTSMQERLHEIGLLRALGTTQGQILSMFLAEAICLSFLGGLLGLALLGLIYLLVNLAAPDLPLVINPLFLLLGLLLSSLVGLIAGIIPARSASRQSPIEALRAE